jgi:hypothetical protein
MFNLQDMFPIKKREIKVEIMHHAKGFDCVFNLY